METIPENANIHEIKPAADSAIALQNSKLQEKMKRQARTHSLLVSIVVVFASSWFPLNLLNMVMDVFSFFEKSLLVRRHAIY